jgi:hypothetical protein
LAGPVNQVVTGAKTPEQAVDDVHKLLVKVFAS